MNLKLLILAIFINTAYTQSYTFYQSPSLGIGINIPQSFILISEDAEQGLTFYSAEAQAILAFGKNSVPRFNPSQASLAQQEYARDGATIGSEFISEGNDIYSTRINMNFMGEALIGYTFLCPFDSKKGLSVTIMYGAVNGDVPPIKEIGKLIASNLNKELKTDNQVNRSNNTYQSTIEQSNHSNNSSLMYQYSKYLIPAKDNFKRPKELLSGVYVYSSGISSSYSDGSSAYMNSTYYFIFKTDGSFCQFKGKSHASFSEYSYQGSSGEIIDYGHWYIKKVLFDGVNRDALFIKSAKENDKDYFQWLYIEKNQGQPFLFNRPPGNKVKFSKLINLSKVENE